MFKNSCALLGQEQYLSENNPKSIGQYFEKEDKANHSKIIIIGDSLTYGLKLDKVTKQVDVVNKDAGGYGNGYFKPYR